jgi:DNA repair exonuclease SbcCD ATPase subunit
MKLKVDSLLSYKKLEHDFERFPLCSVVGPNGVGKTNFLELLGLVLYGRLSKKPPKDQIASFGAKEGVGSVEWIAPGEGPIKVERTFTPKETVKVYADGEDMKFARNEDAQAFINGLIGPYEIYLATVLYAQEQKDFFVTADEADKKGLLETILKFERYTKAFSQAKAKRDELSLEVLEKQQALDTTRGALDFAEQELSDAQELGSQWEKTASEELKSVKKELADLATEDLKPLEEKVVKAQRRVRTLEEAMPKEVDLGSLQSAYDMALRSYKDAQKAYQDHVKAGVIGVNCPTCGRPWEDKKKQAEAREKFEATKARLEKRGKAAKTDLLTAEAELSKAEASRNPEAVEKAQKALDAAKDVYDEAVQAKSDAAARNDTVEAQKERLREKIQDLKKNPHTEAIERLKAKIRENRKELVTTTDLIEELRDEMAYYEFWVRGFGNQGIKSLLLDLHAEYINDRIGYYLDKVTEGEITAIFSTQKELKSKDLRDKISFQIAVEGQWQDYKAISGGQKTVVNMAVMFAVRDLALKEYTVLPIMLLDETFRELDAAYSSAVLRLLQELSARTYIYVVSHSEVLRDWAPNAIVISKKNGVSQAEAA